jgi:hypothetical protein
MGIDQSGDTYYDMWIVMVRDALSCLDHRHYSWIHLPNKGGFYDQDDFIFKVWECVRYEYMQAINDKDWFDSNVLKKKKG